MDEKLARKGQITRDGGVPPGGSVDSENSKARAREQTEAVNETKRIKTKLDYSHLQGHTEPV